MKVPSRRTPRRTCLLLAGLLSTFGAQGLVGCSTEAVGISQCRDVESARCEASVGCGVIEQEGVEDCQRFYRDHCLHGIEGNKTPSAEQHKRCLTLIEDAGEAAAGSKGMGGAAQTHEDACAIVEAPWDYEECAYLADKEDGAGGEAAEE